MPTADDCRKSTIEWFQGKTIIEKMYMGILFILCLLIIIYASKGTNDSSNLLEVCTTMPCLHGASKILRFRNDTADPCNNFYSYACGNFLENAEKSETYSLEEFQKQQVIEFYRQPSNENDHDISKTARRLFQSCINQREKVLQQMKNLKKVFKEAGGWPVLEGSNWNKSEYDWVNATYKLREIGYPYSIFLDLTIEPDSDKKNSYIYKTSTADTTDYLYNLNETDKIELMTNIALMFGAEDRKKASVQMEETYRFWEELKRVRNYYLRSTQGSSRHRKLIHYPSKIADYQRMKLKDFQDKYGDLFDWKEFNSAIADPTYKLSIDQDQLFPPVEIMKFWVELIDSTYKRIQANYMMWRVIEQTIPYMHCELRVAKGGIRKHENFQEYCLKETEDRFLVSPIRLEIDRFYVTKEKRRHVEVLLKNIRSAFVEMLQKAKWIQENVKPKFVQRVRQLHFVIARLDSDFGDNVLNQMMVDMRDLKVNESSFMDFIAQANRNFASMKYSQYGVPRSESLLDKWYVNSKTPVYIKEHNILYVPGAVVQLYFNEQRPNYLNYGEIGVVLGQYLGEVISEVIDRTKQSMKHREEFQKEVICLEKEFSNCMQKEIDPKTCDQRVSAQAQQRIGEMVSYTAYKNWQEKNEEEAELIGSNNTPSQLFWISAASALCPRGNLEEFNSDEVFATKEVFLSLANDDHFKEDFKCVTESKLNKC